MANPLDIKTINFSFQTEALAIGTVTKTLFKAPTDSLGGGITIVAAGASCDDTIATGSSVVFNLLRYSTAYVVEGTVGAGLGSTGWTAGTPKAWTISDAFVDAGEYIVLEVGGTVANLGTAYTNTQIALNGWVLYTMGY
jgi:hypothetical protein